MKHAIASIQDTAMKPPTSAFASCASVAMVSLFFALFCGHSSAAETPDFNKHIAPLFQQYCLDCHAAQDPEHGLILESYDTLLKGGDNGLVFVPGKSAGSLLVKFLEGRSGKQGKNQFMPPGKREHLGPAEIALIKTWIDAGAPAPKEPKAGLASVVIPDIVPKVAPPKAIYALAGSPGTKWIAVGRYGRVELWNADTRHVARTLTGLRGNINALAFSADGSQVFAAGGDAGLFGEARQWQTAEGSPVRTFAGHTDACYALALSPDGTILATGSYDQKIQLWSTETGQGLSTLKGHNGCVYGLAFRPDGKLLASASADRTVKLWNVATGARTDTFSQPLKELYAVAFSPDGQRLVAGGADNRIRLWSISEKALEGTNPLLLSRFAHEGAILKLVFSDDGKTLVSSAADKSVKIWDATEMTEKLVLEKQPDWTPGLALTAGHQLVLGRLDGSLEVYDAKTGKLISAVKTAFGVPPSGGKQRPDRLKAELQTQKSVFAQAAASGKAKKAKGATKKNAMAAPKPGQPTLTGLEPRGVQRGVPGEIKLIGKELDRLTAVTFSNPKITAELLPAGKTNATEVVIKITVARDLARGEYNMFGVAPAGNTGKLKLYVDDLPQVSAVKATKNSGPQALPQLPVSVWGTLAEVGERDEFQFAGRAGETLVFDLAVKSVGSKAANTTLQLLDPRGTELASNRGFDDTGEPLLAWKVPADGRYTIRVSETTLAASPDSHYRLSIGPLTCITGFFPLSVSARAETDVELFGYNLPQQKIRLKSAGPGEMDLPLDPDQFRSRRALKVIVSDMAEITEIEPNDQPSQATPIKVPASVNGRILPATKDRAEDVDLFQVEAKAGETWIIETTAARRGSPVDTKIEVLYADGQPVPRLLLQAVRDSYINFRSVDANLPDIRLANWPEMELNEYVYFQGDVAKIFRMPRGPDSGFQFYAANGKRRAYFDTSATAHANDETAYTVVPCPPGAKLVPSGLPVFTLYYANDDDGERELGTDSRLFFTAPATGKYLVRVTDTRARQSDRSVYRLTLREPKPDFKVTLRPENPTVGPGSAIGFEVAADRMDGFDGEIKVEIAGLPAGWYATSPIVIQPGHLAAAGSLHANAEVATTGGTDWSKTQITATATVGGKPVTRPVNNFGTVKLGERPKLILAFSLDVDGKPVGDPAVAPEKPYEIVIAPGQTVPAWLRVVRNGETNLVNLDMDNLPHGVIVDNIGLSGVLIREGESEREIFLTAARWVPEQERLCHAVISTGRATGGSAGLQTSFPVLMKVQKKALLQTSANR